MVKTKKKTIQVNLLFGSADELTILKKRYETIVKAKGLTYENGKKRSFNRWCINQILEASKHENDLIINEKANEQTIKQNQQVN